MYEMPGIMAWRNAGKELVSGNAVPESTGMTVEDYTKMVTNEKFVLCNSIERGFYQSNAGFYFFNATVCEIFVSFASSKKR